MTEPSISGPGSVFEKVLERLSSPYVIALLGGLFLVDLAVPDPLPFIDEAALFMVTVLLARWRGRHSERDDGSGVKPPPKDVTPRE